MTPDSFRAEYPDWTLETFKLGGIPLWSAQRTFLTLRGPVLVTVESPFLSALADRLRVNEISWTPIEEVMRQDIAEDRARRNGSREPSVVDLRNGMSNS